MRIIAYGKHSSLNRSVSSAYCRFITVFASSQQPNHLIRPFPPHLLIMRFCPSATSTTIRGKGSLLITDPFYRESPSLGFHLLVLKPLWSEAQSNPGDPCGGKPKIVKLRRCTPNPPCHESFNINPEILFLLVNWITY